MGKVYRCGQVHEYLAVTTRVNNQQTPSEHVTLSLNVLYGDFFSFLSTPFKVHAVFHADSHLECDHVCIVRTNQSTRHSLPAATSRIEVATSSDEQAKQNDSINSSCFSDNLFIYSVR